MKLFYIFAIFIATCFAQSDFLANTKRPEFFKMTDEAVPTLEFTLLNDEWTTLKNMIGRAGQWNTLSNEFKTKEAKMKFVLEGTERQFDKVTFSLGGVSSRYYPKQAFNVKIRGKEENLYGRKQFRIRSEAREPSFLRSKLFCDINNRLGLMSISANYIRMSINGEFMGFYVIFDSLKMSWAEIEYNDGETTHLIQSKELNSDLTYQSYTTNNYESENEDNPDMTDFANLLRTLDAANTVAQMEAVMDVETTFKYILLDWLTGSWDHYCMFGHNYNMYKPPNGKWTLVLYDYDATFGQDLSMGLMFRTPNGINGDRVETWTKARFEDWHGGKHIVDVILKDRPSLFTKCLQDIITNAFNPKLLFPHIDALKNFIYPYVKEDKTPVNGKLPGRINTQSSSYDYTLDEWENNSEYTTVPTMFMFMKSNSYGLKKWIIDKFNFVCTTYSNIDCSVASEYLNGQFKTTTTRKTYTTTTKKPKTTAVLTTTSTSRPTNVNCWATKLGYSCCSNSNVEVAFEDADGKWGVENNDWCGIIVEEPCWATALGFNCCTSCLPVAYEDADGKWGVENNDWCGLINC